MRFNPTHSAVFYTTDTEIHTLLPGLGNKIVQNELKELNAGFLTLERTRAMATANQKINKSPVTSSSRKRVTATSI